MTLVTEVSVINNKKRGKTHKYPNFIIKPYVKGANPIFLTAKNALP